MKCGLTILCLILLVLFFFYCTCTWVKIHLQQLFESLDGNINQYKTVALVHQGPAFLRIPDVKKTEGVGAGVDQEEHREWG